MKKNILFYSTALALTAAMLSGLANFTNKLGVSAFNSPILYTAVKNMLAAALLVGLILLMGKRKEIASLSKNQRGKLLAISIIGGTVPFALFFTGLKTTSAINASLIHKTLFLWVILLAVPLLKEQIRWQACAGFFLIFLGNIFIGGFEHFSFHAGELMILSATLFWAVENIIAKKALKDISSIVVSGARMLLGSLILLPVAAIQSGGEAAAGSDASVWLFVLLTGVLLFGYVLTWYEALKYAPVTYVAALLTPATLITNLLNAVFVTHALTGRQITSGIFYVVGALLLILVAKKSYRALPGKTQVSLQSSDS